MKINSIEITNIASLKGKHFIDFNNILPFSKVFAITGDTGSGKSSILNSISLALYGQNYKRAINQIDLITLGEEYGEVKLEFNLKNKDYIAHWHCKVRKKNKELLKKPLPLRSIYFKDENREIELEKTAEDIIGLNFDQFCKTIILNQGQFSNFLLSSFTQRKNILETLYTQYNLTNLSVSNKRNIEKIEIELDKINANIEGMNSEDFLDIDKKIDSSKSFKKDIEKNNKEIKNDEFSYKNLNEIIQSLVSLNSNSSSLKSEKKALFELNTLINSSMEDLNKSKDFYKSEFQNSKDIIKKLDLDKENTQNYLRLEKEIESQISDIENKEKQLKDKKLDLTRIQKEQSNLKIELKGLNSIVPQKNINQIEESFLSIKSKTELLNSYQKQISIYSENIQKSQIKLDSLKLEKNELNKKGQHIDINDIDQKENQLKASLDKLKEKRAERKIKIQESKNAEKEIKLLQVKLSKLISQKEKIDHKEKENLNKIGTLELALKSFELERMILKLQKESIEKEECLVCHNQNIKDLKLITPKEKDLSSNLLLAQNKAEKTKEENQKLSLEIQYLNKEISSLSEKTMRKIDDSLSDIDKIEGELELTRSLKNQLLNNKQLLNDIETRIKEYNKEVAKEKEALLRVENKSKTTKKQIDDLKDYIKTSINKKNFSSSDLQVWISESKRYYEMHKEIKTQEDFSLQIQKIIDSITEDIQKFYKRIELSKKNMKKISLPKDFMNIDFDLKKNKIEKYLGELDEKVKIKEKNLKSLQISEAQSKSKTSILKEQIREIETNLIALKSNFKESSDLIINKAYQKISSIKEINEMDQSLLNELKEQIQIKIQKTKENVETFKVNHNRLELIIEQYHKAQNEISKHKERISFLSDKLITLKELHSIVGKDEFRNYVLSIIEKNLIIQTNYELQNLCDGRYKIFQKLNKSSGSSDFYIKDNLHLMMNRKISTLSGGETFMVSLAMAIALSELTKGESQIESFFIDEGFGTLDSESIDDVLEMIHNLEARGKSIALISHIKDLTNRIPINLRLKKNSLGESKISILMN